MNDPINYGGPAFPRASGPAQEGVNTQAHYGMTLRDWLAGQETLSDFDHPETCVAPTLTTALAGAGPEKSSKEDPLAWAVWEATWRAKLRYIRADAMLKARGGVS